MRMISSGFTNSFEFELWQLIFINLTMHIVGIPRPPSLDSGTQFLADFFQKIEQIIPDYSNLMILGL